MSTRPADSERAPVASAPAASRWPVGSTRSRALPRWTAAFALSLSAHAALVAVLLMGSTPPIEGVPSQAIIVDLDFDPSPTRQPDQVAGPEIADAVDPAPEPPVLEPEAPAPDVLPEPAEATPPLSTAVPEPTAPPRTEAEAVVPPALEKPEPRPREEARVEPLHEEPQDHSHETKQERPTAASQARGASAPQAGGGGRPAPAAVATWAAKVGQHLAQHRRYPAGARARRQQGTAIIRITLDESGRVLSRSLLKGSGNAALDEESLNLLLRAQPLPKPPPNMAVPVTLTVPIRFAIQARGKGT